MLSVLFFLFLDLGLVRLPPPPLAPFLPGDAFAASAASSRSRSFLRRNLRSSGEPTIAG